MDSTENKEENEKKKKNKGPYYKLLRCCFKLTFSLLVFVTTSIMLLYAVVFTVNSAIWNPISVPSQCKIVKSSVDLRSSKVCEKGLLNYKAEHAFYSFERNNFRCRDDYYWASVFKVEYTDHLGHVRLAWTEAPNEALPSHCRPSFGVAWLTKDKFQVNETYDCWYTLGISRVNIYQDGFFQCQAKHPSSAEMLKQYIVLSRRTLRSLFASGASFRHRRLDVLAGAIAGFFTPLISFTLIGFLLHLRSRFLKSCAARMLQLKRACFFIAYFSFMSWLTIQYLKWLGLPEIL